jgi:periplasmic protein TonB
MFEVPSTGARIAGAARIALPLLLALLLTACASPGLLPKAEQQIALQEARIGTVGADTLDESAIIPIFRVPPHYTRDLQMHGVEGWVVIEATINQEGQLEDLVAVEATREELIGPALDALRRWRFRPVVVDGEAIRVRVVQPIHFRLEIPEVE